MILLFFCSMLKKAGENFDNRSIFCNRDLVKVIQIFPVVLIAPIFFAQRRWNITNNLTLQLKATILDVFKIYINLSRYTYFTNFRMLINNSHEYIFKYLEGN